MSNSQEDSNKKQEAAETRPVPSQAEGDVETVDADLAEKEEKDKPSKA